MGLDITAYSNLTYVGHHEEWPDEDGLTPLERGRLIHEVFEAFYAEWQKRGHRAVTADRLDDGRG